MDQLIPFVTFVVGAFLAGFAVWVMGKSRETGAFERGRSSTLVEQTALTERLKHLEARLAETLDTYSKQQAELNVLRKDFAAQTEARAVAEQKNARLPELQCELETARAEVLRQSELLQNKTQSLATAEERAARVPLLTEELQSLKNDFAALQAAKSALETVLAERDVALAKDKEAAEKSLALLQAARDQMANAFKDLSAEALEASKKSFLEIANQNMARHQQVAESELEKRQQAIVELVKPVRESLDKVDVKINDLEKSRAGAYEGLTQQIKTLTDTNVHLRTETGNLVRALRSPATRGRWGEMQLRRVVEMAGMTNHCTFDEQVSVTTETGKLRPDLVVNLPAGKKIIVDAKAPISAYLDSLEALDEAAKLICLKNHARLVGERVAELSKKSYHQQFDTPEFVVLFLPAETFFSAALEHDPGLLETAAAANVILATPTTLIALLKAIYYGWKQENIAASARQISELGRELHARVSTMADHWLSVGKHLGQSVKAYNESVGTLESRVLVTTRKFTELGVGSGKEIASAQVPLTPRQLVMESSTVVVEPELLG